MDLTNWNDPAALCVEDNVVTLRGITCLIARILDALPPLIALAALAMVIYSGFNIIMAGADQKAYSSAWSTFTWAVIGLIFLSGSWLLLLLIQKFTGAQITTFGIL